MRRFACRVVFLLLATCPALATQATLDSVRARGALACGVVAEAQDWNKEDVHGDLSALGAEICRATAAAVLGRADRVALHTYPAEPEALRGLASGEVDLLAGATPSITRAAQYKVAFGPPIFWDTQAFLVRHALGLSDASALAGRTVCYIDNTDIGGVLLPEMRARRIGVRAFPFQEEGEMEAGLTGGHCAAISAYASRLAGMRAHFHAMARDFVLLPDVLAVSPASVATRAGDFGWSAVAAAVVDTLVQAEMVGITRVNVAAGRLTFDPVVRHLLGEDWSAGQSLGLAHDWSARVLAATGNYGEVFARTLGEGTPMGLKRGLNAVCLRGGALCAAQVR